MTRRSGGLTTVADSEEATIGFGRPALPDGRRRELDGLVPATLIIGATDRLRASRVAAILEQHTEIQSWGLVAALLRTPVGLLASASLPTSLSSSAR